MRRRALSHVAGALVLAGLVGAVPAGATSWPVYGKDLANSRHAASDGPAPNAVSALEQAWAFEDPDGDFTGTPVVAAGVVVAGSFAGHVYALDAVTGEMRWSADVGAPVNGSAAIDPAAGGGGVVYVPVQSVGAPRLVALALSDGAKRWEAVLTDQDGSSVYASPVYWSGSVYIGTSGPNGDDSTARGTVVALDAETGAVRWRTYTVPEGHDGGPVWSTAAIDTATNTLYVGTGNAYHPPAAETTDAVLALDAATGQILRHFTATPGDTFAPDNPLGPDADFGASPNLIRDPSGQRLVGEGDKTGMYWALDRATLGRAWSTLVGPGSASGGVIGSTAYDGARIYGTDALNGEVWALDRSGKSVWQSTDSGPLDFAPVAVANGVLYSVDPSGTLVARDSASGEVLAKLPLGHPSFGGVSVVGGAVYVAVGIGPLPSPAPQQAGAGMVIAFGDTTHSGAADTSVGVTPGEDATSPPPPPPPARRPQLKLLVKPRRVAAHERTRFRFQVRADGAPVGGVRIRFAHRTRRTGRRGRATIRARLSHRPHRARAHKAGFRATSTVVSVSRR